MNRSTLNPLFLALLFAMQAPAHAMTLETNATYNVSGPNGGFDADPQSASSGSITSYVEFTPPGFYAFTLTVGDGINSARGSANDQGNLAARASWEAADTEQYDFAAMAKSSQTYTNTSGGAMAYTFDFSIPEGVLQVTDYSGANVGSGLFASYSIMIKLNGSSIWNSAAVLDGGRSSHVLDESGTDIGGTYFDNGPGFITVLGYEFGPYSDTLDLGTLNDGESLTLEYLMQVGAVGPAIELGSLAQFGDPNNVNSFPGISGNVTATSTGGGGQIPEPSTLVLLGLGLLGLASAKRRRH